ncbi:DCN1-like protein 3 [Pocillopora damicornis]|uniref:DCN1-like protein 3 n=1 Tax=Pocillopora damicornis TaxID=46731 RepID=UPI000F54D2D4|nr:DCN1-like protein 3 [Pocillopora damicornis]
MGKCFSVCVGDSSTDTTQRKPSQQTTTTSVTTRTFNNSYNQHAPSIMNESFKSKPAEKSVPAKTSSNDIPRTFPLPKQEVDESKIASLFGKYKDDTEDAILADGMEKFCQDLGVDPTEFIVLVLAWKFNASQMCRFTRNEFFEGCKALRVDSIRSLQNKFPELEAEVTNDVEKFKDLYRFTFKFGLDVDEGQRALPKNIALPLWKLVFSRNVPAVLDRWFAYLENRQLRGISRDTWYMFLNFTEAIEPDFENYDDSEAWPSLFDDFVESERELIKQLPKDDAAAIHEEKQENGIIKEESTYSF